MWHYEWPLPRRDVIVQQSDRHRRTRRHETKGRSNAHGTGHHGQKPNATNKRQSKARSRTRAHSRHVSPSVGHKKPLVIKNPHPESNPESQPEHQHLCLREAGTQLSKGHNRGLGRAGQGANEPTPVQPTKGSGKRATSLILPLPNTPGQPATSCPPSPRPPSSPSEEVTPSASSSTVPGLVAMLTAFKVAAPSLKVVSIPQEAPPGISTPQGEDNLPQPVGNVHLEVTFRIIAGATDIEQLKAAGILQSAETASPVQGTPTPAGHREITIGHPTKASTKKSHAKSKNKNKMVIVQPPDLGLRPDGKEQHSVFREPPCPSPAALQQPILPAKEVHAMKEYERPISPAIAANHELSNLLNQLDTNCKITMDGLNLVVDDMIHLRKIDKNQAKRLRQIFKETMSGRSEITVEELLETAMRPLEEENLLEVFYAQSPILKNG